MPGGVFSSGCLAINSNRNQLCEAITLVTQFAEVLPFASAFKNTPFSTVPNSALSLVSPAFDYSYYHKLLLLALAAIMCPLCSACVHACVRVYPSLFFLGAVCLSPPDCNPVVVGSVFCNLSLSVWVCVCASGSICMCVCVFIMCIYALRDLSLLDHSQSFMDNPEIPSGRHEPCCWTQILRPLPTSVEANKSRAEGIRLHLQQEAPAINSS